MSKYFYYTLFFIVFFQSCSEIPIEIKDIEIEPSEKVVLIEELTGASCPNCPKGTAAINSILAKYPKNVVAVGVHGKFLAEKTKDSKYDFRNKDAEDLENWFRPWFGKPTASVNRVLNEDELLTTDLPDLWLSMVEKELQKPQLVNMSMKVNYDTITRVADIEVAYIPLTDLEGNYNTTVYVTESHIIDAQSSNSEIIKNFEHNHVLREIITKFDGDFLVSNPRKNQIIKKNFSYTIPLSTFPELFNPKHMAIIAMMSKSSAENKEVLQAIQQYVVK